ncbi:alanine racemase C-terminal domain-containing protein [Candidatus Paracaedibacter symbiosus]|uniref:alanine racemase C-terminal domain-containing protein n=1 Tax=Candidatus Paracaedibacter symbiosus TaxID=244582 RepID=UPI000A05A9C8|nr:alanine racemase C-terminal domain-containing protein [Candidatus Paracaedibacter symbiosus]
MTVDVTHILESFVHNGAWVQAIGQGITVEKIAQKAGTVPYGMLLGLGKRFQRIYTYHD